MAAHTILGGKVRLYRRGDADNWHASAYYQGKEHRKGTKTDDLALAEEKAEDWYLELRGKARAGLLTPEGKPFAAAADAFMADYEASVEGQRSSRWINEHKAHIENHLKPFFEKFSVPQIDQDRTQEYRIFRFNNPFVRKFAKAEDGKPKPAPRPTAHKTIENEIITLRMILKFCVRKAWLKAVPDVSAPYQKQKKVGHRPWFAPEEYKALYKATSAYKNRNDLRDWERWNAEQLHDLVLFLANTGVRPDEAKNLEHQDVAMVKDGTTRELILEIAVRGKTGYGPCKSRAEAVKPYQRLLNRPRWMPQGRKPRAQKAIALAAAQPIAIPDKPKPTDKVFPGNHIKLFNKILGKAGIKLDRDGKPHTFYSLRHFYICERLSEGADVYQLAKNCRTSVEMIQKHYAIHIMGAIDTAAVNARKPRQRPDEKPPNEDEAIDRHFNFAMAVWGQSRNLPSDQFERLVQRFLAEKPRATPNWHQCLALVLAVTGRIEQAKEELDLATSLIRPGSMEFSCWAYLNRSSDDMAKDIRNMREAIQSQAPISPQFFQGVPVTYR